MLQFDTHPDEGPARIERLTEDAEERGALLEQLEQALIGLELVTAGAFEQPGRAADVEALALIEQLRERGPQSREKRGLALGQARILEPLPQLVRPRLQARERVARPPTPKRSSPKNAANRSLRLPKSNCVGVKPPPRSPACPKRSYSSRVSRFESAS